MIPSYDFDRTPARHCSGLRFAAIAIAAAVIALGLTVMIGWHAHAPALVQLHPSFAPMKYNSALCFVLSGAAVLALSLRGDRWAVPLAGIVALVGILTAAEYIFSKDLGIDELLMRGYIATQTSHPGRMSPVAAGLFSTIGVSLMLFGAFHRRKWACHALGIFSSLVIGLSATAVLGYFTGLAGTSGWELLSRMAMHTSLGFVALGTGLLIIAWREELMATRLSPRWLPISTSIAAFSATIILWQGLKMRDLEETKLFVKAHADIVKYEVATRLDAEIRLLGKIARDAEQPSSAETEGEALDHLQQSPGYQSISWLDPMLQFTWTMPPGRNDPALEQGRIAIEQARQERISKVVAVELPGMGNGVFLAVPVFRNERFDGMLVATIRLEGLMADALKQLPEGYFTTITGDGKNLYQSPGQEEPAGRELAVEVPISLHGGNWTARVSPTPAFVVARQSHFTGAVLVRGGVASLLLGVTVYLAQGAIARSKLLSSANRDLHREMTERREAEARLEAMQEDLREASRRAGMAEVATSVLHNVGNVLNSVNISCSVVTEKMTRSPIGSVGKTADLLLEHADDLPGFFATSPQGAKLPEFLGKLASRLSDERWEIIRELDLLSRNIDHIKEIVDMQQRYARVTGVAEKVSLSELLDDSLHMNGDALVRHQVLLERDDGDRPVITVEKHKVVQILVNLIRNAKHACDESGRTDKRISIRVTSGEGRVQVAIRDNGIGIPEENITRIFRHGYTTRPEGHGFGLHSGALAAKELGGQLHVSSQGTGCGATFTLDIPVNPPVA